MTFRETLFNELAETFVYCYEFVRVAECCLDVIQDKSHIIPCRLHQFRKREFFQFFFLEIIFFTYIICYFSNPLREEGLSLERMLFGGDLCLYFIKLRLLVPQIHILDDCFFIAFD
jgi:hypothetical protein